MIGPYCRRPESRLEHQVRACLLGFLFLLGASCGRELSPEEYFRDVLLKDRQWAYTDFEGKFLVTGAVYARSPAVGLVATFSMDEPDFMRLVSRFRCESDGREPEPWPVSDEDPVGKHLGKRATAFSGAMVFSDWGSLGVNSPIVNSNIKLLRSSKGEVCLYFVRGR